MKLLQQKLVTYLIHYSPLADRLRIQQRLPTWQTLSPILVTEQECQEELRKIPYKKLDANIKAEAMAQVQQIYPILNNHSSSLSIGTKAIDPCPYQRAFAINHPADVHPYYLQALSAYTIKNHELTLQHLAAVTRFLFSEAKFCLILEDDSIPSSGNDSHIALANQLELCLQYLDAYPMGFYDISDSLGLYPNTTPPKINNIPFIQMASGQTRCASSYLLTRASAGSILESSTYPVLPVDWHYSYILSKAGCPTFWSNTPIFTQGSQSGYFQSNQISRNVAILYSD